MAEVAIQLRPYSVRLYHGTRLTDAEIQQVQKLGLRPLRLADRKESLAELLRLHPRWPAVASEFEDVIAAIGPGARAGRREDGHVHACFSRFALLGSCSHYLAYGAEVDGHICHRLFGDDSANSLFDGNERPTSFRSTFRSMSQHKAV